MGEIKLAAAAGKMLSDLWKEVRNDDKVSFSCLHQNLYAPLFAYAKKMLQDEELVDDILQELFIKFWIKRHDIGQIDNVRGYFFRSTRSMALNHIKSANLKLEKISKMSSDFIEFSAEDIIVRAETEKSIKELLATTVNSLPKKQREVIYLRFYENMEYNQIADITGIKYQSVVNHVFRATQSMREIVHTAHVFAA